MTRRIVNFLDLETTGLLDDAGEHRIIEACCALYDIDTAEHVKTWLWRINPLRKIDIRAQKAHKISLADLANEPTFDVVAPAIRGVIDTVALTVAHNGDSFDFPYLKREMARVGHLIKWNKTLDSMQKARWSTHNGKLPRLGELATCLDVEYNPKLAHSAAYDCDVLAQCFFSARALGYFETV